MHFCKNHREGIKIEHSGFVQFSTAFHAGSGFSWCVCFDLLAIYFCSNLFSALSLCFMTLYIKIWKERYTWGCFSYRRAAMRILKYLTRCFRPTESICFSDMDDYMSFELLFSRVRIFFWWRPIFSRNCKNIFVHMYACDIYIYMNFLMCIVIKYRNILTVNVWFVFVYGFPEVNRTLSLRIYKSQKYLKEDQYFNLSCIYLTLTMVGGILHMKMPVCP